MKKKRKLRRIGWREWIALPDLNIPFIKAKVDTGARTSCLHAFDVKVIERDDRQWVQFKVHPHQRNTKTTVHCEEELLEYRKVTSSTGHAAKRPVILSTVVVRGEPWKIELTLTNRDEMGFRMLLGRQAVRGRYLIDPGRSYRGGTPPKEPPEVRVK